MSIWLLGNVSKTGGMANCTNPDQVIQMFEKMLKMLWLTFKSFTKLPCEENVCQFTLWVGFAHVILFVTIDVIKVYLSSWKKKTYKKIGKLLLLRYQVLPELWVPSAAAPQFKVPDYDTIFSCLMMIANHFVLTQHPRSNIQLDISLRIYIWMSWATDCMTAQPWTFLESLCLTLLICKWAFIFVAS